MKKIQLSVAALALLFAASCGSSAEGSKVEADSAKQVSAPVAAAAYKIDNATTKIEWVGSKAIGGAHNGTIGLTDASVVNVENGKVVGGKFIFDLNSLTPVDGDAESNGKLKGHLLAPDFLDVAQFPDASFVITSVTEGAPADSKLAGANATVTGNLMLKGVDKSITFPAIITMSETGLNTKAEFHFDRTQWGMAYGADASLGDKMINKEITLKIDLNATK